MAWDTYAHAIASKNKLSETIHLTGQLQFIRTNQVRMTAGLSLSQDGPSVLSLPGKDPTLMIPDNNSPMFEVSFDESQAWRTENGGALSIIVSRPQPATKNYFTGPWRFAGEIAGSSTDPPTSPAVIPLPFPVAAGQKLFAKACTIRSDGRTTNPFNLPPKIYTQSISNFSSLLTDNFNSYTDGALHGQGGWSGSTNITVQGTTVYEGAKAITATGMASRVVSKICPEKECGYVSFMARRDISTGLPATYQGAYTEDSTPLVIAEIAMFGANIAYTSNWTWHTIVPNYLLNQWYKLDMCWLGPPTYKCKYRVNDGDWSAWVPRQMIASTGPAKKITLQTQALSGNGIAYLDYIH